MSGIRLFKTTFNLCFVLILNEDNSFGINNVMFSLLLPFVQHCRVSTYEGAETTGNYLVFNLKKELDQIEKKNHYDNIYSTIICWNFISFRIHLSYWFITREDTTERNDFLYFILLLKYIQKCTINTPIHVSVIVYKNPLKSLFILSQIVSFETPIKIYELN